MSMSASSGPRAKCDQVVFEAIAKAAEIIVYARSPAPRQHQQGAVSARFNLQIPEVAEIRQSLQHHRQSLHLPLRLEVYSAKSHQLLERWTLEYHTTLHFQQQQQQSQQNYGGSNNSNGDPIVQLRHVCKKVVIWLRTLYCWTRMLPSFGVRGPDLLYRLEVVSGEPSSQELPNFSHRVSPPVPTPYGRLVWKVWYAPHVQKPTTKPIPIAAQQVAPSTPIAMIAKSAPTRENHMLQQQQNNNSYHQPSSFDRSGLLKKTHSNVEDHSDGYTRERPRLTERSHSGNLSHRAALHDPPTYAYNTTAPPTTTTSSSSHHLPPLSSSPLMMAATPPPAFLSSTPPTLGFLLPPPNSNSSRGGNNTTPPFSALPRELSLPEELCSLADDNNAPPMHSLDLLHSSPFKTNASAFSSALAESESWMLRSSTAVLPSSFLRQDHIDEEEEEDMPFAVDFDSDSIGASSSMTQLAHQKKTVHRLHFLTEEKQEDDGMSALSQQLQDFKTFGASLAS
jgi:hypothetical protein